MSIKKNDLDHSVTYFLSLIKEVLYQPEGQKIDCITTDKIFDWDVIYKTALRNSLAGILYPLVARRKECDNIPPELIEMWGNETKRSIFIEYKKYIAIRRIISEAEKEGIRLVFFKGCVLADLYPQYVLRYTSDTDIFVYERDREKAANLLERLGYIKSLEHSKEEVPVYVSKEYYHIIELHFYLWEDYKGRKIDIMIEMNLVREESLIEIEACGMKLTTLGYEEHLIYQMFHIIKHFSIQSVGIRYLVDITLFVNRYGEYIDFPRFWEKMKRLGFAKFCYLFFELGIKYFGMSDEIMKVIPPIDNSNEEALLIDILNLGLLYENKTASWQILGIMRPYLVGEENIPGSRLRRKLKVLFPSRKALPDEFDYAKKNGLLLPVAWIHKMIDFVIRYKKYNKKNNDWYGANQKLTTADYRLNLMKNLGLVDKD